MQLSEKFPTPLCRSQISTGTSSEVEDEGETTSLQLVEFASKETSSTDTASIRDLSNGGNYMPAAEQERITGFFQNALTHLRTHYCQTKDSIRRSGNLNSTSNLSLGLRERTTSGRFSGYRGGLLAATITCGLILLLNVILMAWGTAALSKDGYNWSGVISRGIHQRISRLNTMLHFMLNTLTTLLLASSNYTMQLLSAPTRVEVDRAHQRGRHLDIGILSIRNLHFRYNTTLIVLLIMSSLPISFL